MNGIRVYDAGRFNRQLSIENRVNIPDGFGGFIRQSVVEGSVWASICLQKPTLVSEAGQVRQETTYRILMRFHAAIKPGTQLVTGARRFEVQYISDPDETKRYLECLTIEQ